MKTIKYIIILICIFTFTNQVCAGNPASIKLGTALLRSAKTMVNGVPMHEIYSSLNASQKRGLKVIQKILSENSHGPLTVDFIKDLRTIEAVLKNPQFSNYGKSLPDFLDNIDKLNTFAKQLPPGNHDRFKKIVKSMLTKTKESGDAGKPRFSMVKGGVAEIMELVRYKNHITEIQPLIGNKSFREAVCNGGEMPNKWYLEVKNYPTFQLENAKQSLIAQADNHVMRTANLYDMSKPIEDWPGVLYKFAKDGPTDDNLPHFESALKQQFTDSLIDRFGEIHRSKIEDFVATRIIVDLVAKPPIP